MKAISDKVLVTRYSSIRTRHEYCTVTASGITVVMTDDEARSIRDQLNELFGPSTEPTTQVVHKLASVG